MIGNVVGNYKVVSKIGEGGMGAVFKGIDLMLEREVAIKVLKPELASQPQVVDRFRSEAVTLAKLNHPNVATLYNFFRQSDHFFMVLEYVDGTPLDKLIESYGKMTCEQAIPLFCQMLEGIDHAHGFGIVHRDIKPANMMLTENGLLKVLDFGIARALGSARLTRSGHLIGTIEYMSPEQVRGMDTDARSDIYSLGMVLYEMLTGRVPFASDSEFELMKAQVEQVPTPPREFAPDIPEAVEWAILCATEKDPQKRFQTAGAFGEAIVDSVKTAIATGSLSQIDLRRPTARLSALLVGNQIGSRTSLNSGAGFAQSNPPVSSEIPTFAEAQKLPPPTRFAPTTIENVGSTASLKATRLGTPAEFEATSAAMGGYGSASRQTSPLGRFSRKQYILGSGVAGIIILGIVVALVIIQFRIGAGITEQLDTTPTPLASPQAATVETVEQTSEPVSVESLDPPTSGKEVGPQSDSITTGSRTQPQKSPSSRATAAARERAERAKRAREALNR